MELDCIRFEQSNYFSKIILDYLDDSERIKAFYHRRPAISSFKEQMEEKQFRKEAREILHESLNNQYERDGIKLSKFPAVAENVEALCSANTFTVTTGHQLSLFTGPLYFIYKIASTIKLSRELKAAYPDKNFVPIYWMATEDHDFAEINHFKVLGEKLSWPSQEKGAVGRMKTEGLDAVYEALDQILPAYGKEANELRDLFKKAYLKHSNLAAATRYLAHELFHAYGLVILDGDDRELKGQMKSIFKEELLSEISSSLVSAQNEELSKHYKIQVNPREINLFYLEDQLRGRIIKDQDKYRIDESEIEFSEAEILAELQNFPERFSPNVILRPVYQEVILPNLAYIGGGGELAYWFQLKSTFEHFKLELPILILRNSVMYVDKVQEQVIQELRLETVDVFKRTGDLIKEWHEKNADADLALEKEKQAVEKFYADLLKKVSAQTKGLNDYVQAMHKREEKKINQLSDKLIREHRKKNEVFSRKLEKLKAELFPNENLQERVENLSLLYLDQGAEFIEELIELFEIPTENFYKIKGN